jgi:hypothetical protein
MNWRWPDVASVLIIGIDDALVALHKGAGEC